MFLASAGARPGCPERPVWCSPAAPCSLDSGTGPGGCTCLSVYSHKCQSYFHSLAPVKGKETQEETSDQRGQRRHVCTDSRSVLCPDIVGHVWKGNRGRWRTPSGQQHSVTQTHWNTAVDIMSSICSLWCDATSNHANSGEGWFADGCMEGSCLANGDKTRMLKTEVKSTGRWEWNDA